MIRVLNFSSVQGALTQFATYCIPSQRFVVSYEKILVVLLINIMKHLLASATVSIQALQYHWVIKRIRLQYLKATATYIPA